MVCVSPDQVRSLILGHLEARLAAKGLNSQQLSDEFDLLVEDVVDSMGFLQLILSVEEQFGIQLDFEDMEPESLTTLGPLCQYVAERIKLSSSATHDELLRTS